MRLRSARPFFILSALVIVVGCASPRYQDLVAPFGLRKALDLKIVEDGETVDLYFRTEDNRQPVKGVKIILGEGENESLYVSDEKGHLAFPVSYRLLEENPGFQLIKPEGIQKVTVRFTFSFNSHDLGKPAKKIDVRDLIRWRSVPVGPDRVYVEEGVPKENVEKMTLLLQGEREALASLTGSAPPPIAVALIASETGVIRGSSDADGRSIWPVVPSRINDDTTTIGTIVHEWTHDLLKRNFNWESAPEERFLEDGLCELMAHLVYLRIRKSPVSPVAGGRLRTHLSRRPKMSTRGSGRAERPGVIGASIGVNFVRVMDERSIS